MQAAVGASSRGTISGNSDRESGVTNSGGIQCGVFGAITLTCLHTARTTMLEKKKKKLKNAQVVVCQLNGGRQLSMLRRNKKSINAVEIWLGQIVRKIGTHRFGHYPN
jgi:hypothetical protein